MFFPLHDQNNQKLKTVPVISYIIIGLCFLVFLFQITLLVGDQSGKGSILNRFNHRHGLIPAVFFSGKTTYQVGPKAKQLSEAQLDELEDNEDARVEEIMVRSNTLWLWLMPLTCLFLHGGWMHILGNCWFFWIFSDNVEERLGNGLFLLFYLTTGIFSSLFHAFLRPESVIPLIGASGAISAVMGAYVAFFPKNRVTSYFCPVWFFIRRIDVPAIVVLGFYLLTNLLAMSQAGLSATTAFDAHISGFLVGFAIAWTMEKFKKAKS